MTLVLISVSALLCDLFQRIFVAPWVWLRPSRRIPALSKWIQSMAWLMTRPVIVIGGAKIPKPPVVPCEPGVLILMNHQSLLDIPMMVRAVPSGYPRIVTRKRYLRWIPLISHMIRLYQYPIVDPRAKTAEGRRMIADLQEAGRTSDVPIGVFPEGTRTRNGEIGRFKTTGLQLMLQARPWTVYVIVVDGFWKRAKFIHFLLGMGEIEGKVELVGVFEWTDPEADPTPFISDIRERMVDRLAEMRGAAVA